LEREAGQYNTVYLTQDSVAEAKTAAASLCNLVKMVVENELSNGFAVIRPPGHHADFAVPVPVETEEVNVPESQGVDNGQLAVNIADDDIAEGERKDLVGDHDEIDHVEAAFAAERGANVTDAMRTRLNAQFMPQGVEILDVIIERIRLPDYIQNQMTRKTLVISQNAEQRMQHKFNMQELYQKEEIKTLQQTHTERKNEAIEEGKEQAVQHQNELKLMKEEGLKAISNLEAENKINKQLIYENGAHAVQTVNLMSEMEVDRIKLEAELKSIQEKTQAKYASNEITAKSELESANLVAKGNKLVYNAHGKVAPMIRTLNSHLTNKKRLEVNDSLASNSKVIVTGISGGNAANKMILADAALSEVNALHESSPSRSEMLSEIAVASGNAKVRLINQ